MNRKILLAASAAALGLSFASSPASAASNAYGVSTLASLRNCGGASATQECPGGQRLRPFALDGGIWKSTASSGYVETRPIPQAGSYGQGRAELTGSGLYLPTLHAVSSSAPTDARVNGSALGFTTFTYNGSAEQAFSLKSTLTVDDSFKSPDNPLLREGAFVSFFVGIFDADIFQKTYLDFASGSINTNSAYACGDDGLLGFGYGTPAAKGGSFTVSTKTTACPGSSLVLKPGQQVVAYANLSMFTNRGGYLDALHTMTTELDPELGGEAIAALKQNLVSGVPEPTTWAMMLGGFGVIGAASRRRVRPKITYA
jgi:hypothetical protein